MIKPRIKIVRYCLGGNRYYIMNAVVDNKPLRPVYDLNMDILFDRMRNTPNLSFTHKIGEPPSWEY